MKKEKLCAFNCGRIVQEGKRLCKYHLEHQRLKMAEFRAARRKKGLCSRCGSTARILPNGKVSTLCQICRTHVSRLEREKLAVTPKNQKKKRKRKKTTKNHKSKAL